MLQGLDHVQIAMPEGGEAEARRFYGVLLGMTEIEKPEPLRSRGGCWFVSGRLQVHLGVDARFVPADKAHPAFLTEDLEALRSALQVAGVNLQADEADVRKRFYAFDPFGNRLEFIAAADGFSVPNYGAEGGEG